MRIAVAGATGLVGRHVVDALGERGHEVVPVCRSAGIDLLTGEGLAGALVGVDTVVDATSPRTAPADGGAAFFRSVAGHLQREASTAGVGHVVLLSIVGIDDAVEGHPAAKLVHEATHREGPVPLTVVRTTQFHEFPAQLRLWAGRPARVVVPDVRVRTVAARTVGRVLLEAAEGAPLDRATDVAGPEEADLVELARRFVARFDLATEIEPGPGDPHRDWLPGPGARAEGPTFEDWLATADAAALA